MSTTNYNLATPELVDDSTILPVSNNFTILDTVIKEISDIIQGHIATVNAHTDAQINNTSDVAGSKVKDALNSLNLILIGHINSLTAHASQNITVDSSDPSLAGQDDVLSALEYLQTEVEQIIAQSGTSDTEVVNARLSSIYGTFITLKERLDSADVILNNLHESVTAPNPGTATLTSSALSVTKTDSYEGISQLVKFGGGSLYNAVTNGDFSDGTTGWSAENSVLSVSNKILSITGTGASSSAVYRLLNFYNAKVGDKIFYYTKAKVTNANCLSMFAYMRDGADINIQPIPNIQNPIQNKWYELYDIGTVVNGGLIDIRGYHEYADPATANGKVMEVDGNVGVFVINLTGTQYEDYTADEMNAAVGEYFEGLKSVESGEVISRGINLYDPSKTADAIAGGVTTYNTATGKRVFNLTIGATRFPEYLYNLTPNTSYTVSSTRIVYVSGTQTGIMQSVTQEGTTTTSSTTGDLVFTSGASGLVKIRLYSNTSSGTGDVEFSYLMIRKSVYSSTYIEPNGGTLKVTYTNPDLFDGSQVPNLTENTVETNANGEINAFKRNDGKRQIDQTYSWGVGEPLANSILAFIPNFVTTYGYAQLSFNSNSFITDSGFAGGFVYSIDEEGIYIDDSTLYMRINKSRLATSDLNGFLAWIAANAFNYVGQLATTITIPQSDFPSYGIQLEGSLKSSDDTTEFIMGDYNIMPSSVVVNYSRSNNQSINNLDDAVVGITNRIDNMSKDNWFSLALINSFVNVGGNYSNLEMRKDESGYTNLRGRISTGTSGTSPSTIPLGFRPDKTLTFPIVSNDAFGYCTIDNLGAITVFGNSTYYDLGQITFKAVKL